MSTRDAVVALVPAAGRGLRLGAQRPKALVPVLGESLLVRSLRGLLDAGCVQRVVVAAPEDELAAVTAETASLPAVDVVVGGADRTDSVRRALAVAERVVPEAGIALVHDAARAFTPASVIGDVVRAVRAGSPAVVPVLPVSDTIKRVDGDGVVSGTVDRAPLRAVQTPQGFTVDVLRAAYAGAADAASDDAGLVEAIGQPVTTVDGDPRALKITTAFDLAVAESVLAVPDDELPDEPLDDQSRADDRSRAEERSR